MPQVPRNIRIKIADVSNDTRKIYDVDVIGMMWSALDDSLKKRQLLWTPESTERPLLLEVHVVQYEEGNIVLRSLLPLWGKTLLVLKGDLKKGGQVIASAETRRVISLTERGMTWAAWSKIFPLSAEDMVSQLLKKM